MERKIYVFIIFVPHIDIVDNFGNKPNRCLLIPFEGIKRSKRKKINDIYQCHHSFCSLTFNGPRSDQESDKEKAIP